MAERVSRCLLFGGLAIFIVCFIAVSTAHENGALAPTWVVLLWFGSLPAILLGMLG